MVPARKQAMDEGMNALISRETWELVSAPKDVGCRWFYTLKYPPDSSAWLSLVLNLLFVIQITQCLFVVLSLAQ